MQQSHWCHNGKRANAAGLKGQQEHSPGQRPGYCGHETFAQKGQKYWRRCSSFALSGRWLLTPFTQGVALGWQLAGLSGRFRQIADNHTHFSFSLPVTGHYIDNGRDVCYVHRAVAIHVAPCVTIKAGWFKAVWFWLFLVGFH